MSSASSVITTLLNIVECRVLPLLRLSVPEGNKPFGATILKSADLTPLQVSVNLTRESPLLHGETNCIREYFALPSTERPATQDCIFFATHEPCSLCLSGIAWTRFPTLYYLFSLEETKDVIGIPQDIQILEEVFKVRAPGDTDETLAARPLYNKLNLFFKAKSIGELLEEVEDMETRQRLKLEVQRVKGIWSEFVGGIGAQGNGD
jgi:tRNA(Arg) A34 adenosine deaminase TadA